MSDPRYGFRFSLVDGAAITVCVAAALGLWSTIGDWALAFPVVLGHFFLFCNVFRVRRSYELAWSGLFLLNASLWLFGGAFSWVGLLATQTPVTLIAIGAEVRSPRYHGSWARRVNAGLDEYLGAAPAALAREASVAERVA
jgi:hypothetical protein